MNVTIDSNNTETYINISTKDDYKGSTVTTMSATTVLGTDTPQDVGIDILYGLLGALTMSLILLVFYCLWREIRKRCLQRTTHIIPSTIKVINPANENPQSQDRQSVAFIPPLIEEGSVGEVTVAEEVEEEGMKMVMPPPCPIKLKDLSAVIHEQRNKPEPFADEYLSIPRGQQASWKDGLMTMDKNRFKNIIAYDHSRVVLQICGEDMSSDYINANYIQGYDGRDMFIAAQGPIPRTSADFWRMIWEADSSIIIMLTNLMEAGKIKCDKYWPEGEKTKEFDKISITHLQTVTLPDFTIRTFSLAKDDNRHEVKQFHFTGWPDHGVPLHATGLLNFRRKIRQEMTDLDKTGPIIIHCSAGVGRTGAYLANDYLIQQAESEECVDVCTCVAQLRKNRVNMVQTRDQYAFVYSALLEAILVGETLIPCYEFSTMYAGMLSPDPYSHSTKLEQQYKLLDDMKPMLTESDHLVAMDPNNINKNRSLDILPINIRYPLLMTVVEGRTNYINAVFVDGRKQPSKFIVTQMPFEDTVVDMWRLLLDYKCSCVVMLNKGDSDEEKLGEYWSQEDSSFKEEVLSVTMEEETKGDMCIARDLVVTNQRRKNSQKVRHFQYLHWPAEGRPDATDLFDLYNEIQHWQKISGQIGPIVVHCLDGAERSGVFVAISNLVDMMSVEQELDVFQVVQTIRTNRPHFINTMEQYRFLYEASKMFMDTFCTYSNFR